MFDWDEHNIEHIARHGVEPEEVEEAMTDPGRVKQNTYNFRGERRKLLVGASEAGRILHVVYTRRSDKLRPITARDASERQRRRYRK